MFGASRSASERSALSLAGLAVRYYKESVVFAIFFFVNWTKTLPTKTTVAPDRALLRGKTGRQWGSETARDSPGVRAFEAAALFYLFAYATTTAVTIGPLPALSFSL